MSSKLRSRSAANAADLPVTSVADFDAIRHDIGHRLGGVGPEFWLTIVFTGDPDLV